MVHLHKHLEANVSSHADARDEANAASQTVCVVGLGYIGLPTAAILASRGYQVLGVDIRQDVVNTIGSGRIHICEPHLEDLVQSVVASGKLRVAMQPAAADIFIICVPTPITKDKAPDLSYVESAAQSVRPFVNANSLIILESTSPPGTTEKVITKKAIPHDLRVGQDVFVAYCPERVLPGHILKEAVENDRVVGGVTPACTERAVGFYETFVRGKVFATDSVTAELVKLVENSFRDINIAFANEVSMLAHGLNASPFEIIALANKHPRVNILNPGPGVGGHCISVDPWFLAHAAPQTTPLVQAARQVNSRKPTFVVEQIAQTVRQHQIKSIGCLGLTYKADVDDLRESPSLEIVRELRRHVDAEILACDPLVETSSFSEFPLTPLGEVLGRSELLVLLTDHRQFLEIPAEVLMQKHLVDPRGAWRSSTMPLRRAS